MTDEMWAKFKENGKRRSISDVLFDSFDMLGEDEQDKYFEEKLKNNSKPLDKSEK